MSNSSERSDLCNICHSQPIDGHICPNAHIFCKECIFRWLSCSSTCPVCRIEFNSEYPPIPLIGASSESSSLPQNKKLSRLVNLVSHLLQDQIGDLLSEPVGRNDVGCSTSDFEECDEGTIMVDELIEDNERLKQRVSYLEIENGNMRSELMNRSPVKYSRTYVNCLEKVLDEKEAELASLRNRRMEVKDFCFGCPGTQITVYSMDERNRLVETCERWPVSPFSSPERTNGGLKRRRI